MKFSQKENVKILSNLSFCIVCQADKFQWKMFKILFQWYKSAVKDILLLLSLKKVNLGVIT